MLAVHPQWKLRVLVVWEPILPTDWRSPTTGALARISDPRARQFWDPKHLVAQFLRKTAGERPPPASGYYWDLAAVYAPHARWGGKSVPAFWNGPVIYSTAGVQQTLTQEQPR
jgi:hypothetical protein